MPKYKLVCFDVDGTLIDNVTFSWPIFHDYFQTDKHRREDARSKFFSGKISYLEWAEHDISLWKEKNAKKDDFFKAKDEVQKIINQVCNISTPALFRFAREFSYCLWPLPLGVQPPNTPPSPVPPQCCPWGPAG